MMKNDDIKYQVDKEETLDVPEKSLEEIVREVSEEEKLSEEEILQIIDAFKSAEKIGNPHKKKKKNKDKIKAKRKISKKSKRRNR